MTDRIRLFPPAPSLRRFVRFYANREVRASGSSVAHLVPARAFPLLEFVIGDRFRVHYPDEARVETSPVNVLVGPLTQCKSKLEFQGTVECFVILFQPAGLFELFGVPMPELTDRAQDAHSVLGSFVSRLQGALEGCDHVTQRTRAADSLLLRYALAAKRFDGISAAATRMLSACGNVRVSDLAGETGLSLRQFERRFVRQVGVKPKVFSRIVRFEAALDRKARSVGKSWTEVAHEFGYYDQMHMVHDFRVFMAGTPTQALGEIEAVFRERIQAIRSGRQISGGDEALQLIL